MPIYRLCSVCKQQVLDSDWSTHKARHKGHKKVGSTLIHEETADEAAITEVVPAQALGMTRRITRSTPVEHDDTHVALVDPPKSSIGQKLASLMEIKIFLSRACWFSVYFAFFSFFAIIGYLIYSNADIIGGYIVSFFQWGGGLFGAAWLWSSGLFKSVAQHTAQDISAAVNSTFAPINTSAGNMTSTPVVQNYRNNATLASQYANSLLHNVGNDFTEMGLCADCWSFMGLQKYSDAIAEQIKGLKDVDYDAVIIPLSIRLEKCKSSAQDAMNMAKLKGEDQKRSAFKALQACNVTGGRRL